VTAVSVPIAVTVVTVVRAETVVVAMVAVAAAIVARAASVQKVVRAATRTMFRISSRIDPTGQIYRKRAASAALFHL